ncbi:MAG TPA: glycosyltransferase family 9 protein [Candidatus Kapabacteria bacterium]|nr:glycosyltransferase family 9 protein [Candidatus Kapabacteria bacterium]
MRFLDTQILSRVVIVQTAFLGDVLLTLPMLRALKKQYPVKFLAAVVTPEAAEALSAESCVDELLLYNKRNAEKKNDAFENICREIRRRDFSCSLLPHRSFRSAYMAYRAGVKTRVGFHNSPGAWLYTDRIVYHYAMPEAQRDISLLSVFSANTGMESALFSHTEMKPVKNEEVHIVIAPGSQWKTKMWMTERYGELVAFCAEQGWHIDICGSKKDAEICGEIFSRAASPLVENHCGKTGVPEFSALVRRATAVVCNDSAPIHIANEVGTPVVAIFGPTVPEFGFAPRGTYDQVMQAEGLLCRPCTIHGGARCPLGTHACMREISSEMVIDALHHVVNLQLANADRFS